MTKVTKVVIPAAGLGTRLLSATKEQPKEMLPIFVGSKSGEVFVKPIVQVIFEQLYDCGLREFFFVVGKGKRAIEDHFVPDYDYIDNLIRRNKSSQAQVLKEFYDKLESSTIVWINQPSPLGFGHAVLLTKDLIGSADFIVHAGDTVILSKNNRHVKEALRIHRPNSHSCTLSVRQVPDPRQFGVVEGKKVRGRLLTVKSVEEKPAVPKTDLAIMPLYVFDPIIFKALEKTKPGKGNEIQLTDGIRKIIEWKYPVQALKLDPSDLWIDVGTPDTYWLAQSSTYNYYKNRSKA